MIQIQDGVISSYHRLIFLFGLFDEMDVKEVADGDGINDPHRDRLLIRMSPCTHLCP